MLLELPRLSVIIFLQRIYSEKTPLCGKGEMGKIFLPQHNLLWINTFHHQTLSACVSQEQPREQRCSRPCSMSHRAVCLSSSCCRSGGRQDSSQPPRLACFSPALCSGRCSLTADMHFGTAASCSPVHIHCTQQPALHTSEVTDETSLKAAGPFLTFSHYI